MRRSITLWFDDVAARAVHGDTPILIAVCRDPHMAGALCEWLDVAIPALGELIVKRLAAVDVAAQVEQVGRESQAIALVVPDATLASDAELRQRWRRWNLQRDALRTDLVATATETVPPRRVLILVCTELPFRLIADQARDLISVAEVMPVLDEPPALDPGDTALVSQYRQVIDELEAHYRVSTADVMQRIYDRAPLPAELAESDLHRWQDAAQLLRRV